MNRHTPVPPHAPQVSLFARFVTDLLRQVGEIARALRHRREVWHLADLDERTLRDIGLSRSEVDGALAEPFIRDPSLVLVRSVERRARLQAKPSEKRRERPVVRLVGDARCA